MKDYRLVGKSVWFGKKESQSGEGGGGGSGLSYLSDCTPKGLKIWISVDLDCTLKSVAARGLVVNEFKNLSKIK